MCRYSANEAGSNLSPPKSSHRLFLRTRGIFCGSRLATREGRKAIAADEMAAMPAATPHWILLAQTAVYFKNAAHIVDPGCCKHCWNVFHTSRAKLEVENIAAPTQHVAAGSEKKHSF